MSVLKSRLASLTAFLGIFSLLFIAAIPVLCISVTGESIHIPLMVISIVLLGVGVLLLPFGWIYFGRLLTLRGVAAAIERERMYEVDAICTALSLPRRKVVRRIRRILKIKVLRGYFFDGRFVHPTYRLGADITVD